MEKTHIMITGREWEGPDIIEGIKVQKECRLLGVQLDYKGKNIKSNFGYLQGSDWRMRIILWWRLCPVNSSVVFAEISR
jgi:hypothetical protein